MNNMHEDDRIKTRDILISCDDMITSYVSFERFFTRKFHPNIERFYEKVRNGLEGQYESILLLISDIHTCCGKDCF